MTDRGLSTVLNYVLMLTVVSLLISGLVFGVGNTVENRQQEALGEELDVVAQRLAADLATADRLAVETDGGGTVELTADLPRRAVGSRYEIEIADEGDDRYRITLRSHEPEMSAEAYVRTTTPVEAGAVDGGNVRIAYTGSELEVTDV